MKNRRGLNPKMAEEVLESVVDIKGYQLRYYCRDNFERKRLDQLLVINKGVWLTKPYM